MFPNPSPFPTSTLKCLLENTELADLLFKNFPLTDDDDPLKSDKQLLNGDIGSKLGWNSSAFLGPNLWDKDQLYSAGSNNGANGSLSSPSSTTTTNNNGTTSLNGSSSTSTSSTSTNSSTSSSSSSANNSNSNGLNLNLHHEKSISLTNNPNTNFKVENIDIDEFLCENNLNLNDIDQFSTHFENVQENRSTSPQQQHPHSHQQQQQQQQQGNVHHGHHHPLHHPHLLNHLHQHDSLILHSPMQTAPGKSPDEDSISHQSSSSSRKYSEDDPLVKHSHPKMKKSRKSSSQSNLNVAHSPGPSKQFVPDELKDEKYWARRRKNNLAAKRSRDARRMKENQVALRADFLERENDQLKKQLEDLKRENQKLKVKLIQYESSLK